MHILFVNRICGLFGGAEQAILDMVQGLQERGHQCDLAYGERARGAEKFAASFRQAYPCSELSDASSAEPERPLSAIISEAEPDTVFLHNTVNLPEGVELLQGPRTVRMVHDVGLICPTGLGYFRHGKCSCNCPAGWRCWLDLAFLARGESKWMPVKYAPVGKKLQEMRRHKSLDALITVSDYMEKRLVANGFDAEKICVANPVRHLPAVSPTRPPDHPTLLFVGTLQRGKGLDLLFQALQRLSCPFQLSIVGEGKSKSELERLCRDLALQDSVTFHGWVDNSALRSFYEEARVVVVPTRAPESFCFIGPEAMHYGRPVVAFDVGGVSSWLEHEHTGFLVPEQDVVAYAAALERLLTDSALATAMGRNAATRVRERFVFENYLNHVEGALAGDVSDGYGASTPPFE